MPKILSTYFQKYFSVHIYVVKDNIRHFAVCHFKLIDFCKELNLQKSPPKPLKLTVITKIHAVFVHVQQFLERKKRQGFVFGMGLYREVSKNHVNIFFK